jgi:hypothetical protein
MTTNDVAQIFDTVLSIPGMNDAVRIDLKISRKNVLLLNQVIKRGLTVKEGDKKSDLLAGLPAETIAELRTISDEFLEKAGLVELSEKLTNLSSAT